MSIQNAATRRSPVAGHLPRRLAVGNELMLRPTMYIIYRLAVGLNRRALCAAGQ